MKGILIKNARLVNEGSIEKRDVLIEGALIKKIASQISDIPPNTKIIDAKNRYLIPGVIDDQVHFREPGLTHKADIESEARAAVAGGTTSFIEMPNTIPQATTQELLEEKFKIAQKVSLANYSFMIGGTNDNLDELLKTNGRNVAGIKLFLGSSTGNMLVDDEKVLEKAREKGYEIDTFLENNNSYEFLKESGGLIITGNTGTNVADICVYLKEDRQ